MKEKSVPGSFRDPSGYVYRSNGIIYRRVNKTYQKSYELLKNSGLYEYLIGQNLLIRHKEIKIENSDLPDSFIDIQPELIPFISYPYEWSFSQLRDAALLTLEIQQIALEYGMSLKDASAYNVQFYNGAPVFIDTLSFEEYKPDIPWVAYQQFCEHFLAPLVLMAKVDVRLNKLLCNYIDGIPIELASKLLPKKTYFKFGILAHIHLLAFAKTRYSNSELKKGNIKPVSKKSQQGIISNLTKTIKNIVCEASDTEWSTYYEQNNNYENESMSAKEKFVLDGLDLIKPKMVWDFGANTGRFSRLASANGINTVAFDIDYSCVDSNYKKSKELNDQNLLPILFDFTNPSPAIGWDNSERNSLSGRGRPDMVFALALIHHLAISNNLPLDKIAQYMVKYGKSLIIEFVPKSDSMVRKLLATREDIFPDYTQDKFEDVFSNYFKIIKHQQVEGSDRCLYLMESIVNV